VTLSRLLIVAAFVTGCGNNVTIKNNKLESVTPLTNQQLASYEKAGTLVKSSPVRIVYQGQQLPVSEYSSKMALDFINALPQGSQVPVIYTGAADKTQVVIETIRRQ
jgi:hypothetical protein